MKLAYVMGGIAKECVTPASLELISIGFILFTNLFISAANYRRVFFSFQELGYFHSIGCLKMYLADLCSLRRG